MLESFKHFWDSVHEPVKQILELVVKVGPNLLGPRVGSVPNGHGFMGISFAQVAESTSKEGVMGLLSTVALMQTERNL